MHDVLSAQIMPGMTFLIALFALIFGKGFALMISLKLLWLLLGLLTVYYVYKIIGLFTKNKIIAVLPCLFFLSPEYIWMNNLILTETPYIFLFVMLVYHSLRLAKNPNTKDYIFIVIYYLLAVFIRPNIGIFPIFLAIYLLLNKYDFKLLLKQGVIAGIILICTLIPWIYRNYKVFDRFIPLTYGMGNPLLLGTYQGYDYPLDEDLNYAENVIVPDDMKYYLENPNEKDYMTRYYLLEYDGLVAKYRMQKWWEQAPKSMLKSYLIYKPYLLVNNSFYWQEILGISTSFVTLFRKIEIILFVICAFIVLIDRKKIKEWLFLMAVYGTQVALYAYTFAFARYAISMFFLRYIVIGMGISVVVEFMKKRRQI